jgi:hypothetical protein
MASFDYKTFLKVQGETGVGAVGALGMAFGMPSCMLNLAAGALNILPSSVLGEMQGTMKSAKSKANGVTKQLLNKLFLDTGIVGFDTDTGTLQFKSVSTALGIDNDNKQAGQDIGGVLGAFQYAASFGAQIYQNYTDITDQINSVSDCLDKWKTMQDFSKGNSADQKAALSPEDLQAEFDAKYAGEKAKLEKSKAFIAACDDQISAINAVLKARADDPSLEPKFLDSVELDQFLDPTTFTRVSLEDPGLEEDDDTFRLTYGPPQSVDGQYVLTKDGLYYDSQSGGLDPVFLAISGIVPPGDKWKYDYDPNLGGKGDMISIKSLNVFRDNLFDTDRIDDSMGMQDNYNLDHFLQVLRQQRDKHIYDLSSELTNYIASDGEGSAIVNNQRQLIMSEIANHNYKITKRKKQIEIAIKAPSLFGEGDGPLFPLGKIPINDFGYLEDYNLMVDLEKQNALIFEQAEVDGMVLPLNPRFVASPPKPASLSFEHLNVPTVGKGSIIYTPSGSTGAPSGTVLALTDQIETDGLFAIYNFLDTNMALPSSTNFNTTNCATMDRYNDAQLVGTNRNSVFLSGLAIPYLEGVTKPRPFRASTDTYPASACGSYVKLPDTKEFRNLTYNPSGFTMEFWVHVPNIGNGNLGWLSSTTSSLTKVVLANENVGVMSGVSAISHDGTIRDLDYLENNRGGCFPRGMICGFTRDRRITQDVTQDTPLYGRRGFSNDNVANDPASSLSFFIAPTQARDFSSCSWINNDECQDYQSFFKMKVDLSANKIGSVSSQFVLIDVTVDPRKNKIKFYADGELVATSSVDKVFGQDPFMTPQLPTFTHPNSFEYSSTTVDGPLSIRQGPLLDTHFTPWIVGGGYTDGMYKYGNFMGGGVTADGATRSGVVSGLRGHIGSLKFYGKPLTNREVLKNYNAQQGFFKTIAGTR